MQEDVYQTMYEIEDRHWWYASKQKIVQNLLTRYVKAPAGQAGAKPKVADLGCGCGAMLAKLQGDYDAVGVDGSPLAQAFSAKRGVRVELGELPDGITLPRNEFDAVLLLDVLEHVEDDLKSAREAASLLKPGGVMICTVPAFMFLWSYWDTLHHHFRRYSRPQFRKLFEQEGLKIEFVSYANFWLFPLAAATRLFQKGAAPKDEKTAMKVPMPPVNATLRTIYSSERFLLGRVPLPWGLSVVAVARKV